MKRRVLAIAVACLSVAFLAAGSEQPVATWRVGDPASIKFAVAGVLLVASTLLLLTTFDRGRSSAVLRLDWFLPTLRKQRTDQTASHSLPGRTLRRLVPRIFQSNRTTKRRGLFRRGVRWLGVSWMASPTRRVVQGICLLSFLTLFLYVCWPYNASPRPPGKMSTGWTLSELDQQTGEFVFNRSGENELVQLSEVLYLASVSTTAPTDSEVAAFRVISATESDVRLRPTGELPPILLDTLLTRADGWTLYETNPSAWPSHYADELARKEVVPAETFLLIDPLVSLSTAVASRSWVGSLVSAAVILIVCVLIPRGFCGYLCPLGTTIDLFDWAIAGRVKRFRVPDDGWWVHIKYYLLAGTMVCAVMGVLVSGFFSAIPVITRGMLFLVDPLQSGSQRGWHLVPSFNFGHLISLVLFAAVLSLGFLRPRFWCKYVCPSGAVFSLGNLFRVTERKVESSCINCNKCVEICPFDAIKPDFTTRTTDCTMCQSCGGVCPTHAIKFVERWNRVELKVLNDPPIYESPLGRRGFLSLASGSVAAVAGGVGLASVTQAFGAKLDDPDAFRPVRPPGSVPEKEFLQMCIRCGECFKACPNNVLQPEAFQQGLDGLWTPMVVADWAGCESSCNACGQVCPTGAIRPLPLEEKRVARMGLAIVNESTCLPFAGREACDLCVQECISAGYDAIEYTQVGTAMDDEGVPIEGSGFLAPVVLGDKCVGCGLCQTRCYAINVKDRGVLDKSAIIIEAGAGREDRMLSGSYRDLRQSTPQKPDLRQTHNSNAGDSVPFDPPVDPFGVKSDSINETTQDTDVDPFGVQ